MKISCENCKNYEPKEYLSVHTFLGKPFEYWLKLEATSHLTDQDAKELLRLSRNLANCATEITTNVTYHREHLFNYINGLNSQRFINSLKESK